MTETTFHIFTENPYTHTHTHTHTRKHVVCTGQEALFALNIHPSCLWGGSYMNIQSQTRRIQRDGVTAQMKNKFPLFPTVSSARHYHTDRSVTFLPATLEANEKSLGWKMQYQTCDLFRGVIKNSKHAQIVNQWNWLQWLCARGGGRGGLFKDCQKTS